MDAYLIDYLRSGKAWLLVGSGPSIEMGYASWRALAEAAINAVTTERGPKDKPALDALMQSADYPAVFDLAVKALGSGRLLQVLQGRLQAQFNSGRVYELISRWPIPVYLTTNYDDELTNHLTRAGETYLPYSNSAEHLSYLLPEASGIICKLHGDLRSEDGLILTGSQYREILEGPSWQDWRTKLTSIFQMNRVVVLGYSITDRHVRHVLEAAKRGSGVQQPVCWIAPDVPLALAKELLEKWRIRVIPYDNRDGQHRQLLRLVENLSDFVPPRTSVRIKNQIAAVSRSPLGSQAAAPGFFVFNKLAAADDFEKTRVEVVLAAIQSVRSQFANGQFEIHDPLEAIGWPKDMKLSRDLQDRVVAAGVEQRILVVAGEKVQFSPDAENVIAERQHAFEHARARFRLAVKLRIRRNFTALTEDDATGIATDIDAALTGYFREGGLTLASTMFHERRDAEPQLAVPASIARFINEASAKYDDLLHRQAFSSASVDIFVRGEAAEREYVGRISQGFFGFHAIGVFGDAAAERLKRGKETVWLIDSSAQIPAAAVGAESNPAFADCFCRLRDMGIRLLTTEKLFDESREHLWFADRVIQKNGITSPMVIAAATGQAPFYKSNVFLQGFIRWQAAGNPRDWEAYLHEIGGIRRADAENVAAGLNRLGFEVVPFAAWPGYEDTDLQAALEAADEIASRTATHRGDEDPTVQDDLLKKAQPEAEALLVIRHERDGKYHMLLRGSSPAFFVSNTSVLNLFERDRVTWQPEAFLRFASTLSGGTSSAGAERAFEALVWSIAQSGFSVVDDRTVELVFGGVIDESLIRLEEQRAAYDELLARKYGEPLEMVMERVARTARPMAAIQLANEIAEEQANRRHKVEQTLAKTEQHLASVEKRAREAERGLAGVGRYAKKMAERRRKAEQNRRRAQSRRKKKR